MQKFWNWIHDDSGGRVLRLEGTIDSEVFFGDEVTPQAFRDELYAEEGDITLWINSMGGNVMAAAEIYTMLRDYPGKVTVKIGSLAASAASVIAMAGDKVLMSPVSLLMIHDPMMLAMGNESDLMKAINTLRSVKASIVNAYEDKTGLSADEIGEMMTNETWLDAKEAVEKGFADKVLYVKNRRSKDVEPETDTEGEPENVEAIKAEAREAWKAFYAKLKHQMFVNFAGSPDEDASVTDEESVETIPAETDVESSETGVNETVEDAAAGIPVEDTKTPTAEEPKPPVIGMDGKTEDGSVPYEILKDKLEWLK